MRHHDPAWWPPNDSLGRATPYDFVQPGVTVGAHDQQVDSVGLHICLEHLPDRTALDLNRFERGLDSVFGEMVDEGCPGFLFRRRCLVGCRDNAHIRSRLKHWQCVRNRSCGRRGMIPRDYGLIEYHRQFAGEFLRTHQDWPARFEYQLLDKLFRSVIVWLD